MEEIEVLRQKLNEEVSARKMAELALEEKEKELRRLQTLAQTTKETTYVEKPGVNLVTNRPRLASLMSNLNLAVLVEDENRKILLVNQKFCSMFSISVMPEELIGSDAKDLEEKYKRFFQDPEVFIHKKNILLNNRQKLLEEVIELKYGRVVKRDFIPVYSGNDYLGHVWTYEDVTDLMAVKRRIESISRFAHESPNPILRCTPEGQLLYANAAAKPFVEALMTSAYTENYTEAKDSITKTLELAYKTRQTITIEVEINNRVFDAVIVPVENEEYINIYGTDITDIKSAESKIHLLKELLDQLDEYIQVIDKEGDFIFVNTASAERFGYTPEELTGKNIKSFLKSFYDGMTWEEQFQFFKDKQRFILESTHTRADNITYPVEASIKHTGANGKEYIISFSRDISVRKNIEEALKTQKEFYEDILNNLPADVAVFNTNYEYLFVNPAGIRDEKLRKWIIGKNDFDYCKYRGKDESLAIKRKEKHDEVRLSKKSIEWEDSTTTKNNEINYNLRRFKPVLDDEGNVKIIIGYGVDITEIKQVQDQLAKSEELHRLVIYAANDGIWDWDIKTGHLFLSERWKNMLGYQDDELSNHISIWGTVMPHEDLLIAKKLLEDHFENGTPYTYKLRYYHKNGSIRWVMCRGFAVRNRKGEVYRMVGSCTDITDTKIAEEKLKDNEEKFQAIFNLSYDAKFLVDPETNKIIDCNQRAVELFQATSKEELINLAIGTLRKDPLENEEYKQIGTDIERKGYWNREVLYATRKGNNFWGSTVGKTIRFNKKELGLARITDVTKKKKTEEELIKAKQIAEDSTKAKETFLANMSHEIRTPMNGILGMADLLDKTNLDGSQKNYLRLIKNSADNLLVIINDILDLAKIESGKLTLEQIPFDISEVIKNAVLSLTYKAEEKGIALIINPIVIQDSIVIGDPFRLSQIFLNLINNAIKFTENGSVEISGRIPYADDHEITFEFTVKDTGIGIPKEKLDLIFEGFTQASVDTTRKYGGTGLGLTICKDLIQMQGGNIWVESKLNEGSKFIFSLTYKKGTELDEVKISEQEPDYNTLGKLRILLAEDNEVNQFLAKTLLNEWNFEVDIANNGIEALSLFEKRHYDVILMDIQMPHMGGIEATENIRRYKDNSKAIIPIIALTANALVGDAEKYLAAGINDYLSKPFQREMLYKKIYKNVKHKVKEYKIKQMNDGGETNSNLPDYKFLENSFNNNKAFLKRILTIFVETMPEMLESLQDSLAQKDYERIEAAAHKLKSTIDSFRIKPLQETIRKIETNAATRTGLDELTFLVLSTTRILEEAKEDVLQKIESYD